MTDDLYSTVRNAILYTDAAVDNLNVLLRYVLVPMPHKKEIEGLRNELMKVNAQMRIAHENLKLSRLGPSSEEGGKPDAT